MPVFEKRLRLNLHHLSTGPVAFASLLLVGLACVFSFSRSAATAGKAISPALARWSSGITVRAQKRGNPRINLSDGRDVLTDFVGTAGIVEFLRQNRAQPLALASADFDEDGVPDLISGYVVAGSGAITLLRGNVDAIYPNSPEAQQRRADGTFTGAPFLSPALVYAAPQSPDFVGAGDFDCDGHWDVITAARGSDNLFLFSGDGKGGLRLTDEIRLPGAVTALTTGEINRRDGLDDVVVAVETDGGARVIVYEGPEGALRAQPEVFNFEAKAAALALGQLDDDYTQDLVVAAGPDLVIVHGRDRKLTLDRIGQARVAPAKLSRYSLPSAARSIAIGDFDGQRDEEVAVLAEDGAVYMVTPRRNDFSREGEQTAKIGATSWPQAVGLIRARVSGQPGDDLVVIDSRQRQLHLIRSVARETGAESAVSPLATVSPVSLDVKGEPVAALPMRLNSDALSDLVIGINGKSFVSVIETAPAAVFIVNSTGDGGDSNTSDGVCNDGAGNCTLRAAIEQANTSPGPDAINFNIGGSGLQTIAPTSVVFQINDPVTIDGATQPGFTGQPLIELRGGGVSSGNGLIIAAASCTIRGLAIGNFGADGILVSNSGHIIEGNFIGLDVVSGGNASLSNGRHGIEVNNGSDIRIGGTISPSRNVISGNRGRGVFTSSNTSRNVVQGNYVGVNAAGAVGLGNSQGGVAIGGGNNIVGGTSAGARNVISGNVGFGVELGTNPGNIVQGNYIGADAAGMAPINNSVGVGAGDIDVSRTTSHLIGGTSPGARNLISGNSNEGIFFLGVNNNRVECNFIGVDVRGIAGLGNGLNGVRIDQGDGNVIGGTLAGNSSVSADERVDQGNGNVIGGAGTGAGNVIAFNKGAGIAVTSGSGNQVLANSIFSNGGLGIDLGGDGVTPNDSGDGDNGPNNLQNFPILTLAASTSSVTGVRGTLNGAPNTTFSIEFFINSICDPTGNGEGENFLARGSVITDANGNATINVAIPVAAAAGRFVTATATDPQGNTSEFSPCRIVEPPAPFIVDSTGDGGDSNPGDPFCDDGLGNCTLRAAIEQANANAGANTIRFSISGGGPQTIVPRFALPTIADPVVIDGTTQPGFAGAPIIELSGANAGIANGLVITAGNCVIKGLVINRFGSDGILIRGSGATNNMITGNYIGTDRDGLAAAPNGTGGVNVVEGASNNRIGGPAAAERNVISGNIGAGVFLQTNNTTGNIVSGNYIGVGADGVAPLGNTGGTGRVNPGFGVLIGFGARGNAVGGTSLGAGNVIAFNAATGVAIFDDPGSDSSVNNFIFGNSIHSNNGLGIDLGADGVTPNDDGDGDSGPNNRQNSAALSSAVIVSGGVTVQGSLNTRPGAYTLQYFTSPICDPSGYGEGQTFLGSSIVTTNSAGLASFTVQVNASVPANNLMTVTVTNSAGDTSEFSPCIRVTTPGGPSVRPENVIVLPDLITAVGSGFVDGVTVSVGGVSFGQSFIAKVEDQGRRVTQTGRLSNGLTIDALIKPGQQVVITFTNPNGSSTSIQFTRSQPPPPNPNPPLVLTSVTRVGGQIRIAGELTAEPATVYGIYFNLTETVETPDTPDGCPNPETPKTFLGSIKVKTDDDGKASFGSPVPVTFPDPSNGSGIVSAHAIPFNSEVFDVSKKVIDSNCAGFAPSSTVVHFIQTITVTPDQITAIGYGFTDEVEIFVNNVPFKERADVQGNGQARKTVIQKGKLNNDMTISQMIPPGVRVRIRFRNSDGGFIEVYFKN